MIERGRPREYPLAKMQSIIGTRGYRYVITSTFTYLYARVPLSRAIENVRFSCVVENKGNLEMNAFRLCWAFCDLIVAISEAWPNAEYLPRAFRSSLNYVPFQFHFSERVISSVERFQFLTHPSRRSSVLKFYWEYVCSFLTTSIFFDFMLMRRDPFCYLP